MFKLEFLSECSLCGNEKNNFSKEDLFGDPVFYCKKCFKKVSLVDECLALCYDIEDKIKEL